MPAGAAPAGVVLAGGRSSRMGTDKALVPVAGRPMAVRVAAALAAGGCDPVWCQGGDAAALTALGLEVRPDTQAHAGPLAAIAQALHAASPLDVVVAACDLPDLDGASVQAVRAAGAGTPGALVAAADDGTGVHLVAWWSAAAAPVLDELVSAGMVSFRAAVDRLGGVRVPVDPGAVRNVNHPDDLG